MPEEENKPYIRIKKSTLVIIGVAVIAFVVLIISLFFLVHTYRQLHRQGLLSPRRPSQFFRNTPPDYNARRLQESSQVKDWMTFGFVNHVFGLPSEYFQTKLNISDKKYPDLSINSWAKQSNQDAQKLTGEIINLIRNYQNASSTSSINSL